MPRRTVAHGLISVGGTSRDRFNVSLVVRGDSLDPAGVTKLLRAAPTAAHRKGDPRLGKAGRVYAPFHGGFWEFAVQGQRREQLDQVVERCLSYFPTDLRTWKRLAKLGAPTLSCAAFLGGALVDIELSAGIARRLANYGCTFRFSVYADVLDRFTADGVPIEFSVSERDLARCRKVVSRIRDIAHEVFWIEVSAFNHVALHTRGRRRQAVQPGNIVNLKKTRTGWVVDEIVTLGHAPDREPRPS